LGFEAWKLVILGHQKVAIKINFFFDPFILLSRAALDVYRNFGLGRGYRLGGDPLGGLGSGFLGCFVGCFQSCFGGWFGSWFGSWFRDRLGSGLGGWLGGWLLGCPLSYLGGWLVG